MLIRDAARRVARHVWVERRLFEVVGAWSADCPEPEAAALFATLAGHHGWRAGQWAVLQPVLHDLGDDELTTPPGVVALHEAVAGSRGTAARLVAVAEVVLPGLLDDYDRHLAETDEVTDGPVARLLHLVIADVARDRRAAVVSLESVSRIDSEPGLAAHRSRLEQLLLARER